MDSASGASGSVTFGDRVRLAQKKQGTSPRQQRAYSATQAQGHQSAADQTPPGSTGTDTHHQELHRRTSTRASPDEKKQPGKAREPKAAKRDAAAPEEKKKLQFSRWTR